MVGIDLRSRNPGLRLASLEPSSEPRHCADADDPRRDFLCSAHAADAISTSSETERRAVSEASACARSTIRHGRASRPARFVRPVAGTERPRFVPADSSTGRRAAAQRAIIAAERDSGGGGNGGPVRSCPTLSRAPRPVTTPRLNTLYFHLDSWASPRRAGDRGQRLGTGGATGAPTAPHLHFGAAGGSASTPPLCLARSTRLSSPDAIAPARTADASARFATP